MIMANSVWWLLVKKRNKINSKTAVFLLTRSLTKLTIEELQVVLDIGNQVLQKKIGDKK